MEHLRNTIHARVTQETSVNGHYQVEGNIITIENGLNKIDDAIEDAV